VSGKYVIGKPRHINLLSFGSRHFRQYFAEAPRRKKITLRKVVNASGRETICGRGRTKKKTDHKGPTVTYLRTLNSPQKYKDKVGIRKKCELGKRRMTYSKLTWSTLNEKEPIKAGGRRGDSTRALIIKKKQPRVGPESQSRSQTPKKIDPEKPGRTTYTTTNPVTFGPLPIDRKNPDQRRERKSAKTMLEKMEPQPKYIKTRRV